MRSRVMWLGINPHWFSCLVCWEGKIDARSTGVNCDCGPPSGRQRQVWGGRGGLWSLRSREDKRGNLGLTLRNRLPFAGTLLASGSRQYGCTSREGHEGPKQQRLVSFWRLELVGVSEDYGAGQSLWVAASTKEDCG